MARRQIRICFNWLWDWVPEGGEWIPIDCIEEIGAYRRNRPISSSLCPSCQKKREEWDKQLMWPLVFCCCICHRQVWAYDLGRSDYALKRKERGKGKPRFPPPYCPKCYDLFATDGERPLRREELDPEVLQCLLAEERRRKRTERLRKKLRIDFHRELLVVAGDTSPKSPEARMFPDQRPNAAPPSPLDEMRDAEGKLSREYYEEHPEQLLADDLVGGVELYAGLDRLPSGNIRNIFSWNQYAVSLQEQARLSGMKISAIKMAFKRFKPKAREYILDALYPDASENERRALSDQVSQFINGTLEDEEGREM